MAERLQKLIAQAGLASRRQAESWISEGKILLNGKVAQLGDRADLSADEIIVNGRKLAVAEAKVTVLLNKPRGYISTLKDPQGRALVTDLVADIPQRLFPVGRLDYNSEGLLLLTNDGELSQHLSHPRHHVEKTYLVRVRGNVTENKLQALRKGVKLNDGMTHPAKIENVRVGKASSWFEITIGEGRNRQVRRMCETVDLQVVRLKRIRLGQLELGNLPTGSYRRLTPHELGQLRKKP
ncbi:ribosomal large subunit pseudouridine synthase B [Malonomonas rubra DSM 5091]|uniref:Pseudouridine synthase n=1 Tax=Malonomonas rubra DSM 5091 TaxID=1122189 RepID=A0A1M6DLQ7_MALRU|nr:pseudouridine synthase [Malonomonas rubra]SHI74125.1 ribosomal large subunit pseudouridine synthase B [Malonomonas rubra DSM 5091]